MDPEPGHEPTQEIVIAQVAPTPARRCGVMTHAGTPCGQPVVSEEIPFCPMHLQRNQDAAREERYLELLPETLRGQFREQLRSNDIKDLSAEIAVTRTTLGAIYEQIGKRDKDGGLQLSRDDCDRLRDLVNTIRGLVETQAKVKPDQVVTLYEMRQIVSDIITIIGSSLEELNTKLEAVHQFLPADKLADLRGIRERLVRNIQKYAANEMVTRAMVVAYGAPMPKKPEGS